MSKILSLLVVGSVIVGCSGSTGPNGPAASLVFRPGVGSMYVYRAYRFDPSGAIVAGSERIDTTYVVASGITYLGKTNVVQFRSGSDFTSGQMSYYNYESNGDISLGNSNSVGKPGQRNWWAWVPVVSKGSVSTLIYDSTYLQNGSQYHAFRTVTHTYTGEAIINVAGHSLGTSCVTATLVDEDGKYLFETVTNWWAPEIGVEAKSHFTLPDHSGGHGDLISYTIIK